MKKKIKLLKFCLVVVSLLMYFYLVFHNRNQYLYNMSYLKCILYMLLVSLSIYIFGLIENKEKFYKENIVIYIILFMILLISFVFILKRPTFHFYKNWYSGQLQPFHTIISQLEKASLRTFLKNIIGNMFALVPLSLLLMLLNDKYKRISKQTIIILPTIILIELLQAFTHTGTFDVDDIILNYLGAIIFVIFLKKIKLINKIKSLFYKDFKLKNKTKYLTLFITLTILIVFITITLIKL